MQHIFLFSCGIFCSSDNKTPGTISMIPGVFEKADYPRKDNSNYPYSFFSNLLPLLISAIGKLNKINILFENRRVFRGFYYVGK